jgi:subtilase family serine protease
MKKNSKNSLLYGLFYNLMCLLFFKGDYMILSKTYAPISLLVKSLMNNLMYMRNKINFKLKLGLGQFSFLSFCYAPDQVLITTFNKKDFFYDR